ARREDAVVRDDLVARLVGVRPRDRVAHVDAERLRAERGGGDPHVDRRRDPRRGERQDRRGGDWYEQALDVQLRHRDPPVCGVRRVLTGFASFQSTRSAVLRASYTSLTGE